MTDTPVQNKFIYLVSKQAENELLAAFDTSYTQRSSSKTEREKAIVDKMSTDKNRFRIIMSWTFSFPINNLMNLSN